LSSENGTILFNGNICTADPSIPGTSEAVVVKKGRIQAVGSNREILDAYSDESTLDIDLNGRTVIPGLNDSHVHVIRGGLNYNLELRWDGVRSLDQALSMVSEQAERTPDGQWVRVVGGWSPYQFEEERFPTAEEIARVAPDTPVFILHLYDRAWMNEPALEAVNYRDTPPEFPDSQIEFHDTEHGSVATLQAKPNAKILYATLAKAPTLTEPQARNSSRLFMRELNRLGVTSTIDAGGGGQNYPDDYDIIQSLADDDQLTVRIAYNLFTQNPGQELEDFQRWVNMTEPGHGDDFLKVNGAGEMLVYSAADFEEFREPRPDLSGNMEDELHDVVRLLVEHRWPFRIHATYDESISRFLDVFESVDEEIGFDGLRFTFDHAETISDSNIKRVRDLGGGISVQNRMAFQGEAFQERYGDEQARQRPPIRTMLDMGVPVGAGTDATRVSSYNPFYSLYWLITGNTIGHTPLEDSYRLDRLQALRLYTHGSAWFSNDQDQKGTLTEGKKADLTVLSEDYFSIPEEDILDLESVLTMVDGEIVYASEEFDEYDKEPPDVIPNWSPVNGVNVS
jgi:predicted amidohydrolase YtcJ